MPRAASPPSPGGVRHKPAGAPSSPSSAPAGPFADTIAILKTDLHGHEQKAAEVRALIAKLVAYTAANGAEPPEPSPSVRSRSKMTVEERRARQRQKMADFRARKKAAEAERTD
jgi:hypothetical protein